MPTRRLGLLPARHDPRTVRFAALAPSLPAPPVLCHWAARVPSWSVLANDRAGCCAYATAGHLVRAWTANAFGPPGVDVGEAAVLGAYSAGSGYDPADPATDQGAVVLDVLRYWMRVGVGGHRIHGYASLSPANTVHLKQTVFAFGGAYVGLSLPAAAEAQVDAGRPWDVRGSALAGDYAPGSWGGHAVPVVGYDARYLTAVSWGRLQRMTWRFYLAYAAEAWAVLSTADWVGPSGKSPSGLGHHQLDSRLPGVGSSPVLAPEVTA